MKNSFQQQLDQFMIMVIAARELEGTPINNGELKSIEKWFSLVQDSILAINTLVHGQTVLHWNPDKHVPVFSLTSQGQKDRAAAIVAEEQEKLKKENEVPHVCN